MPLVYATVDPPAPPPPPPPSALTPSIPTRLTSAVPSTNSNPPPLARTSSQSDDKSAEEKKAHAADLVAQIKARLAAKASGQNMAGGNAAPPSAPTSLAGPAQTSNLSIHDEIHLHRQLRAVAQITRHHFSRMCKLQRQTVRFTDYHMLR
jgi:hypothetical protein